MSEHVPPWMFRSKLPNKTVQEEKYMGKIPSLLQWIVSNLKQMKWSPTSKLIANVHMHNLFKWILEKLLLCCTFVINKKFLQICTKCVKCKSCGATTPGSGSAATWMYDFQLCYECGQLMDKGNCSHYQYIDCARCHCHMMIELDATTFSLIYYV